MFFCIQSYAFFVAFNLDCVCWAAAVTGLYVNHLPQRLKNRIKLKEPSTRSSPSPSLIAKSSSSWCQQSQMQIQLPTSLIIPPKNQLKTVLKILFAFWFIPYIFTCNKNILIRSRYRPALTKKKQQQTRNLIKLIDQHIKTADTWHIKFDQDFIDQQMYLYVVIWNQTSTSAIYLSSKP